MRGIGWGDGEAGWGGDGEAEGRRRGGYLGEDACGNFRLTDSVAGIGCVPTQSYLHSANRND